MSYMAPALDAGYAIVSVAGTLVTIGNMDAGTGGGDGPVTSRAVEAGVLGAFGALYTWSAYSGYRYRERCIEQWRRRLGPELRR